VLGRSIHFHLFRHSSASYYAPRLNRQELCYRYGWRFCSNMPDIYISRAGIESKPLDEKFTQTELGTVKSELGEMEQAARIKDERIRQLETSVQALQQTLETVTKVLSLNPTLGEIQAALASKERVNRTSRMSPH
jgi:hypothetical protein